MKDKNIDVLVWIAMFLSIVFLFSFAFIFYQYKQIEIENNKVARDSLTEQAYIELETNK